jgi:hypothetical protein
MNPRLKALIFVGVLIAVVAGMVSFSTSSSIDPCEQQWRSHRASYLYQHGVDDSDSSAVADAHIGYVEDCKNGLPQ